MLIPTREEPEEAVSIESAFSSESERREEDGRGGTTEAGARRPFRVVDDMV